MRIPIVLLAWRKLAKNPGLSASLFAGFTAAAALTASIPIFSQAVLQRVLQQSFIEYQDRSGKYPGGYEVQISFRYNGSANQVFDNLPEFGSRVRQAVFTGIDLPVLFSSSSIYLSGLLMEMPKEAEQRLSRSVQVSTVLLPGVKDHVDITAGRMVTSGDNPGDSADGVYEVMMSQDAMKALGLIMNREYPLTNINLETVFRIKVVGVFLPKEESREFWYPNTKYLDKTIFLDPALIDEGFDVLNEMWVMRTEWFFALDYRGIKTRKVRHILETLKTQAQLAREQEATSSVPLTQLLESYLKEERRLKMFLTFLQTPVLIVLAFFLFMLARVIMDDEATEIAVLKSRGAGTGQVFVLYLWLFGFASLFALILGPATGRLLSIVMGSAGGFLEFTADTTIPARLTWHAFAYAGAASGTFLIFMILPVYSASRLSIVEYKRNRSRPSSSKNAPFIIEPIFLGVSLYALYSFRNRQMILQFAQVNTADLPVDPLYFVSSVLFIIGSALVATRLFPLVVAGLHRLFGKTLPPPIFAAMVQLGRAFGRGKYAFLFLVLSVAVGIFNASTARTFNSIESDRIRYFAGADVRMIPFEWSSLDEGGLRRADIVRRRLNRLFPDLAEVKVGYAFSGAVRPRRSLPAEEFERIAGVKKATRVLRIDNAMLVGSRGRLTQASVIAIDPEGFAETAWYRPGLNNYSLESTLRILAERPNLVLLSSSLAEGYTLDTTDAMMVSLEGKSTEVYPAALIEYWPTINPFEMKQQDRHFIIGNLSYLQAMSGLGASEVWIRRDPSVSTLEFYSDLYGHGIRPEELFDVEINLDEKEADPAFKGFNGVLSLGFLTTLAICLLGFLISWSVSLKERLLQFGLFRAFGLTGPSVVLIPLSEQSLIASVALPFGILIGNAASRLYLPLLGVTFTLAEQVPPMRIGAYHRDYYMIMIFVAAILLFAFGALGRYIAGLQMHQAVKLGEE